MSPPQPMLCRRHVSMANWSITAPSHLPCKWSAMMWDTAKIVPKLHAEITSVWNGTTFSRLSSQWHRQSTSFRMSATFHHQSWSCKIFNMLHRAVMRNETKSIQISKTPKTLRILTKALFHCQIWTSWNYLYIKMSIKITTLRWSWFLQVTPPSFFTANSRTLRFRVSALGTEASRESTIEAGEASEKETREVPLSDDGKCHIFDEFMNVEFEE